MAGHRTPVPRAGHLSNSLQRLDNGKLYYSISEVCRMTGLEPHVLRYWENEFSQMRPRKNRSGNRAYRDKEILYIHYIRRLLHDEKYTLQGAKQKLADVPPREILGQINLFPVPLTPSGEQDRVDANLDAESTDDLRLRKELQGIRQGLLEVRRLLDGKTG